MLKLKHLIARFESFAPLDNQCDFDNCGLMYGDLNLQVKKVLITLDLTPEVACEAINKGVDLIIEHHPSIFTPIKNLTDDNPAIKALLMCVKNNIAVYASHTATDFCKDGLCESLLKEFTQCKNVYKLNENDLASARVCKLDNETKLKDLAKSVSEYFKQPYVHYIGNPEKIVKNVAFICGGGGGSIEDIKALINDGTTDVFITGDIKYSVARFTKDAGYAIIDVGHYECEMHFCNLIAKVLKRLVPEIIVEVTDSCTNPYNI